MPYRLTKCENCPTQFKPRDQRKYIGEFRNRAVIEHFYSCPECRHEYTVKYDHPVTNPVYERLKLLEIGLVMHRYDKDRLAEVQIEYEREYELVKCEYDELIGEIDVLVKIEKPHNNL